jgi:hypothetical protein
MSTPLAAKRVLPNRTVEASKVTGFKIVASRQHHPSNGPTTEAAEQYFEEQGIRIELVDGEQFAKLIVEHGVVPTFERNNLIIGAYH